MSGSIEMDGKDFAEMQTEISDLRRQLDRKHAELAAQISASRILAENRDEKVRQLAEAQARIAELEGKIRDYLELHSCSCDEYDGVLCDRCIFATVIAPKEADHE